MENRRHTISAAPRTPVAADRPVRREPASAMAAVSLSLIKSQSSPSMGRTKRKVTPVRRASSAISNLGASDDEGAQFSDTDLKFLAASARKLLHDVYKANYETKEIKFDQRTTPQINHDIKLFNILVRFYGPLLDSSYERTAPLIPTQLHRALFDCSPEGCYIIQLASITGLVLSPTVAMYPDNTDMHIDSGSEPIAVTFHHYRRLLDVLVNVFGPSENVPAHLDMDVLTLAFDICTAVCISILHI
ncbi:hypothetical protein BC828DRAFT_82511 [Blastocladiella britannica]|nr:hypothetical protein BC828DRAFT_82511 [Blastocladiella britannica]